jgi:uncharacterized circularly permuted ATP-grasp superfamily protein
MPSSEPEYTSAVEELDHAIFNDPRINSELFERLIGMQHELGLLHGSRPLCSFLRPYIMARSQYETLARAAQTLAGVFECLTERALSDDTLLAELCLTEREEKMARVDPGYSRLCVTSRLDAFLSDDHFKFLEYNAESPAGVADQMQLEKVFFTLPHMKDFLERHSHWLPRPHHRLLDALLDTYRQWGGTKERPLIAIVDWQGVSTATEFQILKDYFESENYPTIITDPRELTYDGEALLSGELQIDILYKRVVIHEFLERFDEAHPLARAYIDGKVCMMNSFRTKVPHKKLGFAILSDPAYEHLFTREQISCIRLHVPWTRRVRASSVTFDGAAIEMLELLRRERERFVLKPNDDYGGAGIFIGWEMDANDWEQAIQLALTKPYLAQERVAVRKARLPMFTDRVVAEELIVDFDPFLFLNRVEGGLVRLSSSSLCNISSGGGETALLILEDG